MHATVHADIASSNVKTSPDSTIRLRTRICLGAIMPENRPGWTSFDEACEREQPLDTSERNLFCVMLKAARLALRDAYEGHLHMNLEVKEWPIDRPLTSPTLTAMDQLR